MPTLRSHAKAITNELNPRELGYIKVVSGSLLSAANLAPPEILLEIFSLLTPRDFDNARRTCSQWMRVSLNQDLLKAMLKRAGWWDAWQHDCVRQRNSQLPSDYESEVWRMSKRFATECLLAGRKANIEKPGFHSTAVVDFSGLSRGSQSAKIRKYGSYTPSSATPMKDSHPTKCFNVSECGGYLLVSSGRMIYTYRLNSRRSKAISSIKTEDADLTLISSIQCASEVLIVKLDASTSRLIIAALLKNRVGMICDIEDSSNANTIGIHEDAPRQPPANMCDTSQYRPQYYYNVCSEDHPPKTVAICPGRRCVAFGCAAGIEIHWVDEATKKDQRRHFPMSQPSEILHFLPSSPETPDELRLISSLAGPSVPKCTCRQSPSDPTKKCQFDFLGANNPSSRRSPSLKPSLSLVRATHCHHYRAVPINDGFHMIFVEPRTGLLCIGSDTPIGGPASLTRAFVFVPPFDNNSLNTTKEARTPTAFVVGSDLSWGLRIVAAYHDRVILYSIPLDAFNVIRNERERQRNGVMGDSNLARDWFLNYEHSRKQQETLLQNQNGDWDFLPSVHYRATAMMWPFKIYGKEICRVDNLVDLALQTSHGAARIWTFDASGKATIFDIDTTTSLSDDKCKTLCKYVIVGSGGDLDSVSLAGREDLSAQRPRSTRKRKLALLQDNFAGRYGADRHLLPLSPARTRLHSSTVQGKTSSIRQPSFAACIVDFKIPELGPREGPWRYNNVL